MKSVIVMHSLKLSPCSCMNRFQYHRQKNRNRQKKPRTPLVDRNAPALKNTTVFFKRHLRNTSLSAHFICHSETPPLYPNHVWRRRKSAPRLLSRHIFIFKALASGTGVAERPSDRRSVSVDKHTESAADTNRRGEPQSLANTETTGRGDGKGFLLPLFFRVLLRRRRSSSISGCGCCCRAEMTGRRRRKEKKVSL